jgi:ketosteroid isomerase-like protein
MTTPDPEAATSDAAATSESAPTTPDTDAIAIVRAWHDALAAGDADRLVSLVHDDVEIVGPRGTAHGAEVVRDWVAHAGITLEPRRWFARDNAVVVEQIARWRLPDSSDYGPPQRITTSFVVRDGRIERIARFADLETALAT